MFRSKNHQSPLVLLPVEHQHTAASDLKMYEEIKNTLAAHPFTRDQLKACAIQARPNVEEEEDCTQATLAIVRFLNTMKIETYQPEDGRDIYVTKEKKQLRRGVIKKDYYTEEIALIKDQTSPLNRYLIPMDSKANFTVNLLQEKAKTYYMPTVIKKSALDKELMEHAEKNGGFGIYVLYLSRCAENPEDEFEDGHVFCAYVITDEYNKNHGDKLKKNELINYIELQCMSDPDATWISHSIDELEYDFINDKSKDIRWDFDTSISVACAGTAFVLQNRLRMLEESLGLSTKIKEEKPILSKDEKQIASTPVLMPLDEFAHIPLSLSKETQDNISQVFSFMPTNLQSHTIASNHPITNSTTIPFSQPETKSVITFSPLIDEIQNPNTFSLPGVMVNPYFQATPAIPLDMAFAPNMNAIMPAIQLDRILPAVEKEKETKLDAHIRYTCTFPGCNKSFLKNFTLKRHSKLHTEEPNKICDCCGKYFRQNSDLKRHKKTIHSLEIFPGAESKKFSCVFTGCNKKFKYPQSLARHNKFHAEGCKEICDCCGKAFFEKSSLKRHKNRLTPCTPQMKFSCTFTGCEETYPHKSFLLEHSKCHQEGIGQKADGAQEEKILGLNNLPRAKKRKEMATNNKQGKNKLPCSFSGCDKEFSGKDTLSRHMKLHTEKPGHLCDCCGKGFYNAYSLSLHKKRKTPCTQKLKVLNSPHSFFGKNSSSENNNENNHIQIELLKK